MIIFVFLDFLFSLVCIFFHLFFLFEEFHGKEYKKRFSRVETLMFMSPSLIRFFSIFICMILFDIWGIMLFCLNNTLYSFYFYFIVIFFIFANFLLFIENLNLLLYGNIDLDIYKNKSILLISNFLNSLFFILSFFSAIILYFILFISIIISLLFDPFMNIVLGLIILGLYFIVLSYERKYFYEYLYYIRNRRFSNED